jgi:hypothetical protein
MTSTEMKVSIRTPDYTLFDYKMNKEILEEIKVEQNDENLRRYKSSWLILVHVTRMNNSRMPKIILNYRRNG